MEKVKVYYHKESDTLDIWFGNPEDEYVCEEVGDGVILKKDKLGEVIGVERLSVSKGVDKKQPLSVEVTVE